MRKGDMDGHVNYNQFYIMFNKNEEFDSSKKE